MIDLDAVVEGVDADGSGLIEAWMAIYAGLIMVKDGWTPNGWMVYFSEISHLEMMTRGAPISGLINPG